MVLYCTVGSVITVLYCTVWVSYHGTLLHSWVSYHSTLLHSWVSYHGTPLQTYSMTTLRPLWTSVNSSGQLSQYSTAEIQHDHLKAFVDISEQFRSVNYHSTLLQRYDMTTSRPLWTSVNSSGQLLQYSTVEIRHDHLKAFQDTS